MIAKVTQLIQDSAWQEMGSPSADLNVLSSLHLGPRDCARCLPCVSLTSAPTMDAADAFKFGLKKDSH